MLSVELLKLFITLCMAVAFPTATASLFAELPKLFTALGMAVAVRTTTALLLLLNLDSKMVGGISNVDGSARIRISTTENANTQ